MRQKDKKTMPDIPQLQAELERVKYKYRYRSALRGTIYMLVVVAAIAVLVATVWLPVLQIYGASMAPTLQEGDIVIAVKNSEFESGDLIAFYIGNKILIKRCIAGPGQWVDIDSNGIVYVDEMELKEPYLAERAFGDCNIGLPYQVPDNRFFCMGDQRATSVDSRHTVIGCIAEEQIIGKIVFRVWPLTEAGAIP